MESYVNAYVDGDGLTLVQRHEGRLVFRRAPAEYVTFIPEEQITDDVDRMLRSATAVRGMKTEGTTRKWRRVSWLGEMTRNDICRGKKEKDPKTGEWVSIPSPLTALGVDLFEGDVDPVRRFFTDTGAGVAAPKRCYLDIETDSRLPFSRKTEMRVLSWCVYDDEHDEPVAVGVLDVDTDNAEKALLVALWRAIEPYDQVLAWNGDGFDFPVIFARTTRCGLQIDFRRWLWLDQMALFEKMNKNAAESGDEKQSLALQNVSMSVLGEGKEETPPEVIEAFGNKSMGALTWQLWAAGGKFRELLVRYMCKDTRLQKLIEAKTGFAVLFNTLCEVCRVFPDTAGLNSTHQVDGFLLRLGFERDHHFPTRKFRDTVEQFKGAFVMEPTCKGVTTDVHVADFASLYPSIIITWNMSPETKIAHAPINGPIAPNTCRCPTTGATFRTDVEGILPFALRELIRLRKYWNEKKAAATPGTDEWKDADRRSTAYKVAANSFYGVIGSPFSRYFDPEIGEGVTQNGQWLIKQTMSAGEDRKIVTIYGDTDSLFAVGCSRTAFEEFVKWCNKELYPELLKKQGCTLNEIKLAYEKQFDRIVFTGSKRYAGSYVHYKGKPGKPVPAPGEEFDKEKHSRPEIKGLEYKRGDALLLARRLQEHMIYRVLGGDTFMPGYEEKIKEVLDHVLEGELPIDEIKMAQALTKPLREYVTKIKKDGTKGSDLAHVAVAKILKERGEDVTEGTRIEYIVTDGSETPNKVAPAADYNGQNADRFYLWESKVWPPTMRFLAAAFPDHNWSRWDKVRPPKPRKAGAKALPGQQALVLDPDPPFEFAIHADSLLDLSALIAIFRAHPGKSPLYLTIVTVEGVARLGTPIFVSGDGPMLDALETAYETRWTDYYAASIHGEV